MGKVLATHLQLNLPIHSLPTHTHQSNSIRQKWEIEAFEHTRPLLQAFLEADLRVAFASRTEEPSWAHEVIKIFQVDDQGRCLADYAHACEIYPTSKDKHFKALAKKLDVGFEEMLFFDDERRNIHDVSRLGVVSIHCEDGISLAVLEQGLRRFRERAAKTAGDTPQL